MVRCLPCSNVVRVCKHFRRFFEHLDSGAAPTTVKDVNSVRWIIMQTPYTNTNHTHTISKLFTICIHPRIAEITVIIHRTLTISINVVRLTYVRCVAFLYFDIPWLTREMNNYKK